MVIESHSFSSLTHRPDVPTYLPVGHNSGLAWVLVLALTLSGVCITPLCFSTTIKYETELGKLKVFNILRS